MRRKRIGIGILCLCLLACAVLPGCEIMPAVPETQEETPGRDSHAAGSGSLSRKGYTLEQAVVLSRHNIRAPVAENLDRITPHEWYAWSARPGELSLRGGVLETVLGQYFRKWLEAEGLFPEDFRPGDGQVRFYANSLQRTIATAKYFSAGLLPADIVPVEFHEDYGQEDPVFVPGMFFLSPDYEDAVRTQIEEMLAELSGRLEEGYRLIEDVIDMKESPAWKDGTAAELRTDDLGLSFQAGGMLGLSGSLITAFDISDALILQYYEDGGPQKAGFGHSLTRGQWEQIGWVMEVMQEMMFRVPLIAVNAAHPLLEEIRSELNAEGRIFSFLCGHDSNVASVLSAMGAEPYSLPDTLEKLTPIGVKLVLGRWRAEDGSAYISADLVYQTTEQLVERSMLDLMHPPAIYRLSFENLPMNADGLYRAEDFMDRLDQAIGGYDELARAFSPAEAA